MTGYGPGDAVLDLMLWGLGGLISAAVLLGGLGIFLRRALWAASLPVLVLCASYAVYWLAAAAPALRYMAPAVPGLCVLAGAAGLLLPRSATLAATAFAFVWGTGMVALQEGVHSRIAASQWLWQNLPAGTVIANESAWDDGLPTAIRYNARGDLLYPDVGGHFTSLQLGLEVPDSPEKAHAIASRLASADILAISSERLRRPILALANRFPMTAAYYRMLASGELCYQLVYDNKPGYPVLGNRFDDSGAQEPWSVYDHPQVEIYRKLDCYDAGRVESALLQALEVGS
jgi:hypothetical protein